MQLEKLRHQRLRRHDGNPGVPSDVLVVFEHVSKPKAYEVHACMACVCKSSSLLNCCVVQVPS